MIRCIYNCYTNNLKAFFTTLTLLCLLLYLDLPVLAAFYPRLAVKYIHHLFSRISEGTILVIRNFLQSCYYAFTNVIIYYTMKLLSNLISEGILFKIFLGASPQTPSPLNSLSSLSFYSNYVAKL